MAYAGDQTEQEKKVEELLTSILLELKLANMYNAEKLSSKLTIKDVEFER